MDARENIHNQIDQNERHVEQALNEIAILDRFGHGGGSAARSLRASVGRLQAEIRLLQRMLEGAEGE